MDAYAAMIVYVEAIKGYVEAMKGYVQAMKGYVEWRGTTDLHCFM